MIFLLFHDRRLVRCAETQQEPDNPLALFFRPDDPAARDFIALRAPNIAPQLAHRLVNNASLESIEGVPEWRVRVDSLQVIHDRMLEHARRACDGRLLEAAVAYCAMRQARELIIAKQLRSTDWLAGRQDQLGGLLEQAARAEPTPMVPDDLAAAAGSEIKP